MRYALTGALLAAALALQGCSKHSAAEKGPVAQSDEKDLTQALSGASGLGTIAGALKSTGLSGIFANAGSYTLFAPTDTAFDRLGAKGKALQENNDRAALTAVLRDHLVPGYLTRDDIAKAIGANSGKPVKMATLGSGELSFAKKGDVITVTGADGSAGKLSGQAIAAGPSVALPVDAVLKKL